MISIIVPVYNSQKHLQRCVDSILSQDFKDFELLLIDDGSTDASSVICDDYASVNSNVRVVHQTNAGASAARNKGIKESQGEYITFIDSDDYISKSYLSDFDVLHAYDFQIQGFTLIYSDPSSDDNVIEPISTKDCSVVEIIEDCEINSLIRGPVCKLFKRDLIAKNHIQFPEELSYGEDAIFVKNYLLHCNNKCKMIAKSNYFYTHESANSLTARLHSGQELFKASYDEYCIFKLLLENWPDLSIETISHFKRLKAIDVYQSIYNVIVDKKKSYNYCKLFIRSLDNDFMIFIKNVKNLPPKFKLLNYCYNHLSPVFYIHFFRKIFK